MRGSEKILIAEITINNFSMLPWASLMPAAAVIPAKVIYKFNVAVKRFALRSTNVQCELMLTIENTI